MKTTPKQDYKYNEPLDITGGKITVTKGSGSQDIEMTSNMVTEIDGSPFDPTNLGTRDLKVTYGGQTTTYQVTVKDYVTGITVNPDTVTGAINDTMADLITDNNITYTVTYAKAGFQTAEPLTNSMVSGYSPTSTAKQNLTVKYRDNDANSATNGQDITGSLKVTLSNKVTGVSIVVPTKTSYNHGQSLDLSTGIINLSYADTTTGTLPLSNATITETDGTTPVNMTPEASDYDSTAQRYSKTVKITYTDKDGATDTQNYTFEIINHVTKIEMHGTSHKTDYNVNDTIDLSTGEILVTRAVGSSTTVALDDASVKVTGFDASKEYTNLLLTVSYTENDVTETTNYSVTVTDNVTAITLKGKPKKDYKYNENLNVDGLEIEIERGSGTTTLPVTLAMTSGYDKTQLGEQTVTITYGGQTVTYKVNVKDYVTGISVNPNSIEGKYNDELSDLIDDNQIKYIVTYAKAGVQTAKPLVDTMVNGYNKTTITKQNLTVTYTDNDTNSATNGDTFTTNLEVIIKDELLDVEIETTPKTNYKYGEPLDVSTGTLKVTRSSGVKTGVPIEASMVTEQDGSAFDSTNMTTRNLVVTYEGHKMPYEITVEDYSTGILLTPPTKRTYEYGQPLDLTGGTIERVWASGKDSEKIPLTDSSVTLSAFDPEQEGTQTIYVTWEGQKESFVVTVEDNVVAISMNQTPKKNYKYGDSLDVTGGTITATKTSGKTQIVNITKSMVTGYNPNKLGLQPLTVTYKGKTTSYNVNVEDWVKDINLVKPSKLVYKLNESIDLTGGKVNVVMASGTPASSVSMTDASVKVTGFDSTTEGAKLINVSYQGFTKSFGITVNDLLSGMRIKTLPNKLDYLYGEKLDITGGTIELEKESGATESLPMTFSMISGYNPNKLGTQTLTVTYEGFTQQFIVMVEDYASKLKVQAPSKVEYEYGEALDLAKGTVSIIMASGKISETVDITASMVSGYNANQVGKQTIRVDYKGLQGNFQVNVIDRIKGISLNTEPNKKTYNNGEQIDLTGGTIKVVKSSGTTIVPITKDMITGYKPTYAGTQVITITYGGFTAKFVVEVKEPVKVPTRTRQVERVTTSGDINVEMPTEQVVTKEVVEELKTEIQEGTKPIEKPKKKEEKPTETLGIKDEKEDKPINIGWIAGIIGGIGLLWLIILLIRRYNVKIYVEKDGEFVLIGIDRVSIKNPTVDVDKYLDEDEYSSKVKICLNNSISYKLDEEKIEITYQEKVMTRKIKYQDKPYEIILK